MGGNRGKAPRARGTANMRLAEQPRRPPIHPRGRFPIRPRSQSGAAAAPDPLPKRRVPSPGIALVTALATVALGVKENQVSDAIAAIAGRCRTGRRAGGHRSRLRASSQPGSDLADQLRLLLLYAAVVGGVLAVSWTRIWAGQAAVVAVAPVACALLTTRRPVTFFGLARRDPH